MIGDTDHPEYVPHKNLKFTDQMNLLERAFNTVLVYLTDWIHGQIQYVPELVSFIQKMFPGCPPMNQIEKELSLVLTNTNPIFHYPRAMTPEMIEIGAIHCRAAQPLPAVRIISFLSFILNISY